MEVPEHIAAIAYDAPRLLSAAVEAGLDTKVPSCPEWVVRDLVRHVGGVHRWATSVVATPRHEPWDVELEQVVGAWPSDADTPAWFVEGYTALLSALSDADPETSCWTFLAGTSPLRMWARRQAHETAIHRVDAELAAGEVTPVAGRFAADGIDELLSCFVTRRSSRLRADPPEELRVHCADVEGDWNVEIGPAAVTTTSGAPGACGASPTTSGELSASCEISGAAADLYLALWNRRPSTGIDVTGDRSVLDHFLDRVQISWA